MRRAWLPPLPGPSPRLECKWAAMCQHRPRDAAFRSPDPPLRTTIRSLVVVEVGGGIRTYTIGGRAVIDGYRRSEACSGGRGQVLMPWPNRLGDGRYELAAGRSRRRSMSRSSTTPSTAWSGGRRGTWSRPRRTGPGWSFACSRSPGGAGRWICRSPTSSATTDSRSAPRRTTSPAVAVDAPSVWAGIRTWPRSAVWSTTPSLPCPRIRRTSATIAACRPGPVRSTGHPWTSGPVVSSVTPSWTTPLPVWAGTATAGPPCRWRQPTGRRRRWRCGWTPPTPT